MQISHSSEKRAASLIFVILAAFMVSLLVFKQYLFMPKIIMLGLIFIGAILAGKLRPLVKDWFFFMAFIYLFDSLRGTIFIATCKLHLPVYTTYVLNLEKAIFGKVPSAVLQGLLLKPDPTGNFTWFERTLTVFYGSHFIAFLLVGFLIWIYKPAFFARYKMAFYFMGISGLLLYALVPTTPPWMAANNFGLMPPLEKFNTVLFNAAIPDITTGFDSNPIAAMPSLHAAFPILCSLLLWGIYRWKAFFIYFYTLVIVFAIVYSGDHYVIDVAAGAALATACYIAARTLTARMSQKAETSAGLNVDPGSSALAVKKQLLPGLALLLVGMGMGSFNKTQFVLHANSFGLESPRYVDFFKHDGLYKNNYLVQQYLGHYSVTEKNYQKALGHFERALGLASTQAERTDSQSWVKFCQGQLRREKAPELAPALD